MPMGDDPAQSSFTWKNWDEDAFTEKCQERYGTTPDYEWALDYFGGRNATEDFKDYDNIIFSNGEYDPWQSGGFIKNFTDPEKIKVLYLEKSAHHLDLRLPNDADP